MIGKRIAVIPAYNEEKHIANVVEQTLSFVDEVVVVDDGSSDATYDEVPDHAHVTKVRHPTNVGKGVALKTGIELAIRRGADIVVTLDADMQHDPEDIPRLLEVYEREGADIVVGGRPFDRNMPHIARFGNGVIFSVFSTLFHTLIRDTQSGFRAINPDVYERIIWDTSGYFVETEMLARAGVRGFRCVEVPIETIYLGKATGTTVLDGMGIVLRLIMLKIETFF